MPPPIQAKAPPRRKPQPHKSGKTRAPLASRLAKHTLKPLAALALLIVFSLAAHAQSVGIQFPPFVANSPVLPLPCNGADMLPIVRGNTTYKTGCSAFAGVSALTQDVLGSGTGAISTTVVGLQTRPLLSTAPTIGQCLVWNGSAWAPGSCGSGPAPSALLLVGGDSSSCILVGGDSSSCLLVGGS